MIRELIDMSIDFNVISMTGFGHFQLICVIFDLLAALPGRKTNKIQEIKWCPMVDVFINLYICLYNCFQYTENITII